MIYGTSISYPLGVQMNTVQIRSRDTDLETSSKAGTPVAMMTEATETLNVGIYPVHHGAPDFHLIRIS